jgi:hypothetical protein
MLLSSVYFMLSVNYAECCEQVHYAECSYAKCHYAECRYAKYHYAECHYAECRYAECRGTIGARDRLFAIKLRQRKTLSTFLIFRLTFEGRLEGQPKLEDIGPFL